MAVKKKDPAPNPDPDDEGDGEPDYVTAETVNKAIGARLDAFQKRFAKDLGKQFEDLLAPIMARFEEVPKPDPKAKDSENSEIAKMRKELEAERAARQAGEQERVKDRESAQASQRETLVQQALAKVGITNPTVAKAASSLLLPAVSHAEDGRVIFKRQNKFGVDDELDVDTAVTDWSKTDDGKAFIPAKPVKGAGGQPPSGGGGGAGGGKRIDPKADKAARMAAAREVLSQASRSLIGNSEEI